MDDFIYSWLCKHYDTTRDQITYLMKNELATSFFLIWPTFEQICFKGFMRKSDIANFVSQIEGYVDFELIDDVVKHSYNRYQDARLFNNLKHNDNYATSEAVLGKSYDTLTENEKLEFLMYVIYRYRNNIFHGNKGIQSWVSYSNEIKICIKTMTQLIDMVEGSSL